MNKEEIKHAVLMKIKEAESLVPESLEPDLPPIESLPHIPQQHDYEYRIWGLGEEIRRLILKCPSLKNDKEIYQRILNMCLNPNSKRGRQSFIMLLGYKQYSEYADQLITQVPDKFVDGHILSTIYKMKVPGYSHIMDRYTNNRYNWIRKIAKKYLNIFPLE